MENTKAIRGLCALLVFITHTVPAMNLYTVGSVIARVVHSFGYLSVAVFFFITGYGLMFSYEKRGGSYIDSFWKHRIGPFYIKYLVVLFVYIVVETCLSTEGLESIEIKTLATSLTFGGTYIMNGWYFQVSLLLYILYWAVMRLSPSGNFGRYVLTGIIIFLIICWRMTGHGLWCQSLLAFVLGLYWATYKDKIDSIIGQSWLKCVSITFGLFLLTFALSHWFVFKMFSAVFLVCFSIIMLMRISISFQGLHMAGIYSFEIYAWQGLAIYLMRGPLMYIEDKWIYFGGCVLLTTLISVASHLLFKRIQG